MSELSDQNRSTRLTELPPKKSRTRSKSKVLSDAVAQRIVGPSQLSVSILQESPLNTALKKDQRSGNVEDPLKYGDLSNFFYYELSSFKPNGSLPSKLCIKEMEYRQGSASFLKDSANQRRHAVCRSCGITLHSRYKQTYYTHKNESCKALKKQQQGGAHESPKTNLTAQTFLSKALPCLGAQTNLSTEGLLKFVSAYEGARPDISPDQIISKLPCAKKFHLSEKGLATEIWELVHKTVSESAFFGIAVDGGIDNVKHQNILVSVLYAGANSFVLPPIYHKRYKAFNGIEMAKSIVSMLRPR